MRCPLCGAASVERCSDLRCPTCKKLIVSPKLSLDGGLRCECGPRCFRCACRIDDCACLFEEVPKLPYTRCDGGITVRVVAGRPKRQGLDKTFATRRLRAALVVGDESNHDQIREAAAVVLAWRERVNRIQRWPSTEYRSRLRAFLGSLHIPKKFGPGSIAHILNDVLRLLFTRATTAAEGTAPTGSGYPAAGVPAEIKRNPVAYEILGLWESDPSRAARDILRELYPIPRRQDEPNSHEGGEGADGGHDKSARRAAEAERAAVIIESVVTSALAEARQARSAVRPAKHPFATRQWIPAEKVDEALRFVRDPRPTRGRAERPEGNERVEDARTVDDGFILPSRYPRFS